MKEKKQISLLNSVAVVLVLMSLGACSGKDTRSPDGIFDSPRHHYTVGMDHLDEGELSKAGRGFRLALELDPDYPPALAGMAVLLAEKGEREAALASLERAEEEAADLDENMSFEAMQPIVMKLRVLKILYQRGELSEEALLKSVDIALDSAGDLDPGDPAPFYYAGEAYLAVLKMVEAEVMYSRIAPLQRGYEKEADERLQLLSKVRRFGSGSSVGKRIALVEAVERADMAALLVEELRIVELFANSDDSDKSAFAPPERQSEVRKERYEEMGVPDIQGHPLQNDIELVLDLGVRGLETFGDGSFRPGEPVGRAEAAMIYADILVRASGKPGLAADFIGEKSPFMDLGNDHPAFNAVMLCVTRGLIQADLRSGLFRPAGPVPGIDAMSALRTLHREFDSY
jgi:hypothetical protein